MKQTLRKQVGTFAEQLAAFRANPESPEPSEASSSDSDAQSGSDEEEELDSDAEAERQFKMVRTGVAARPKDKILSMDPKEISYEMVSKKLREVAAARGRATALDRQDQMEMLAYLSGVARGPAQRLEVLVHLITVIFDMNQPTLAPMSTPNWKRCAATLFEIMDLAEGNANISLVDAAPEDERIEEPAADEPVAVWGNPAAFLERLDEEWTGSLKALDPHAHAYMERMKDEPVLLALAAKVTAYLEGLGDSGKLKLAAVALRRMDHLYYKTRPVYEATRKMALTLRDEGASATAEEAAVNGGDGEEGEDGVEAEGGMPVPEIRLPADFDLPETADGLLEELAMVVYKLGNDNQKGQALLDSVYFKSIHNDFYGARDMLLMSRIGEQTQQLDNKMQVLFNRTTAQLGLCAFRAGLISDAHSCLSELYNSGRVKELLAQGIQQHARHHERSAEQEAAERRRQVPFHLHINLELLEASYLISATLLQIPQIAAVGPAKALDRPVSKPLERLMKHYEKQTFVGPPENVRDHIIATCRALLTGDWSKAYTYASSLQCWALLGAAKDTVLAMLKTRFQEEGLRTYLLANAKFYSSLSSQQLCELFELEPRRVHAIVSRLVADELLLGSHDQPTGTVVIHHQELTKLQGFAAMFADKAAILVDMNERALALRTGVVNAEDDEEGGRKGQGDGQQSGKRTRLGGRGPLGGVSSSGRGGRGGRGRGRGGHSSGFMADAGFTGGVFGRGRQQRQRDDSSFTTLGQVGTAGGGGNYRRSQTAV
jgi:translation initiation factor 3 subunit C